MDCCGNCGVTLHDGDTVDEPIDEQELIAEFKRTGVRYVCPNHQTFVVYVAVDTVTAGAAPPCPKGCAAMEPQES